MNKLSQLVGIIAIAILSSVMFSSCDESFIYDYEGDCSVNYRIQFIYDMNMKYANAFAHEVTSVSLYIFDEEGILVSQVHDSGEALASDDYSIEVELTPQETYRLLAWCGIGDEESFNLPDVEEGKTTIEEMKCRMNRAYVGERAIVNDDLHPLFHGMKTLTVTTEPGTHYETISLTKDTNVVRVVLQHLSGEDVNTDEFTFEIQDYNGFLAHDNTLLEDELITYQPWSVTGGRADINADVYGAPMREATTVNVALAELTVNRLCVERRPILVVRRAEDNELVLSIPLIDYALLVKGNYNHSMGDQEYLDRQDEYNLTFFLDRSGDWVSSVIIINSWKVVFNSGVIE